MWLDTEELESARAMKVKLDKAEQLLANIYTNLDDMPNWDTITNENAQVLMRLTREIHDYLEKETGGL